MRQLLAVFVLCCAQSVVAQESIENVNLEDLLNIEVTTATKKAAKLSETPGSITVISRQQILDSNARTLRDVLNVFVPGMDVVPTYFRYGDRVNEGVYSRGLLSDFSQQVLFLLNGMGKFNETTFSSAFPAIEFTLENVERVEISRTPIPLYGGSAITIINIITRDQNIKNNVEFFVDTNANDEASFKSNLLTGRRVTTIFGKPVGKTWHISGHVQGYSDYGQAHRDDNMMGDFAGDQETLRDGTKSALNASLNMKSTDGKWFIQTNYKEIKRDNFMAGAEPSDSNGMWVYGGTHFMGNIKYKPAPEMEVIAGVMRSSFENVVDYDNLPYGGEIHNYDLFLEVNNNFTSDNNSLLVGAKIENEGQHDGTAYVWDDTENRFNYSKDEGLLFAPNISRMVYSVFAEDTMKLGSMTLLAGARFDRYNGFGNERYNLINPRLAISTAPSPSFTLKALYASASRPPSIYEKMGVNLTPLYGNSGTATGVGNLNGIDPEKVETFELSATYHAGGFKAQFTPFYQIFTDKIEFADAAADLNADADLTNDLQAQNNGKAKVMGVDLDFWHYFDAKTYAFLNGTYFQSKDEETNDDTYFLPQIYINGGFNWNVKRWSTNLTAYYRGDRPLPDTNPINKKNIKEHMNANLSVTYRWAGSLHLYGLIENIADEENTVPLFKDGYGVTQRGRTYHVGLRWAM